MTLGTQGIVPRLNPSAPPHDLHTLMKLTLPPAGKPTQMWDAKKIKNTPTPTPTPSHLLPPHTPSYTIAVTAVINLVEGGRREEEVCL